MSIMKPPFYTGLNFGHRLSLGIVGAWLFNEAPPVLGSAMDLSGFGNHGTLVGAAHSVSGKFGNALDFTPGGDRVSVPSALSNISGDVSSLIMWVQIDAYDTSGIVLFGTNTGSSVYWQIANETSVVVMANSVTVPSTDFNGMGWIQLALVSDGTTSSVYLNGVLLGSDTDAVTSLAAGAKNFYIGDWIGSPVGNFEHDGQIDHVLVYNRALSAGEVASLYIDPFQMFHRQPTELWVGSVGAGAPPAGDAGIMTLNTGYWGATYNG